MTTIPPKGKCHELVRGLVFVLVATTITLGLGEIAIRIVSSRKLIYNIEMVKYAKELKMRDPKGEVSHIHRPLSKAHLMGVDVSLNSLGDRGPELTKPRDPHRKRIFVLGSSITMGWGVSFETVFTAVTEQMLNSKKPFGPIVSFEFVNAGIGNYNTDFQFKLFQNQYPVVQPDMVVLHYFISDVQPRTMGRDNFILKHSYLAAFSFDRWSQMKQKFGGQHKDLFTFYKDLYEDNSEPWKQTQREIMEMQATATKDGLPFLVMIIPDIHDLSPGSPYKALYEQIETTFRGLGVPTINTFDAFQHDFGEDVSKLWIQSDDPHPNAKGHALMASVLYNYLIETDPLRLKTPP